MRVTCLPWGHMTMSLARDQTRTAGSGVELTNDKPTTPHNEKKENPEKHIVLKKFGAHPTFLIFVIIVGCHKQANRNAGNFF